MKRPITSAQRFLVGRKLDNFDVDRLASDLSGLIRQETQRSPKKAERLAARFVDRARPHNGILLSTALRTFGWTQHVRGKYAAARDAYLEARKLLARDPVWRARVDLILIDVFMYLDNTSEARSRYRSALRTFERLGDKVQAARTRANYANLLHRQDRHVDAARLYKKALNVLEATDDQRSLAVCRYNLANTLVQTFDFDGATRLHLKAEEGFRTLGYDLYANECRYGLAWLQMLQGNYHHALTGLADCETYYQQAGQHKGAMLCQLDRAETYLALNLFTDARNAARAAERTARKLKLKYEAAKAGLFQAKALLSVGDVPSGKRALQRAGEGFREADNPSFQAVVGVMSALAASGDKTQRSELLKARESLTRTQLPLWEAIADLELLSLYPDADSIRQRLGRNRAVKAVPHLFAAWQTVLGDRLHRLGRKADARRHWIKAAEKMDAVRVKLPPAEVRSFLSRRRNDPYLRLVSDLTDDNPQEAAVWSERHRTAGLWTPVGSDSRRVHDDLSELAQQVSSLATQVDGKTTRGGVNPGLQPRRVRDLQTRVIRGLREIQSSSKTRVTEQANLRSAFAKVSERLPVFQVHMDGRDILTFVHSRGETRCHRHVEGRERLRRYEGLLQLLLGRAVHSGGCSSPFDPEEEAGLFAEMGDWLLGPLKEITRSREILILPEGELSNFPWQALIVDGKPLAEITSVIVNPSLRHFLNAISIDLPDRTVDVFVGNTEGLSASNDELAVFHNNAEWKVTCHERCGRADWPLEGSSGVWHYLGHAQYRSDNPIYSSLQLSDGPLFAADFRLRQNRVGLVTLAACRTGQQSYMPGEESTGLVRSLLEMGARNVIASHWAVDDASTALWMRTFYTSYLKNLTVHQSTREAALAVRERFPSAFHWAAFSVFGAGRE